MMSSLSYSFCVLIFLTISRKLVLDLPIKLGDRTQRLDYLGQVFTRVETEPPPDHTLLPHPARWNSLFVFISQKLSSLKLHLQFKLHFYFPLKKTLKL